MRLKGVTLIERAPSVQLIHRLMSSVRPVAIPPPLNPSLPSRCNSRIVPCRSSAMHLSGSWDSRRLEEYMLEGRDWASVDDYYQEMIRGEKTLAAIACEMPQTYWPDDPTDKIPPGSKKAPRITYQVCISYYGPSFCGFARQPEVKTVEGCLLDALRTIIPPGCPRSSISSSGRTDKGVSALSQCVSFHTRTLLTGEGLKSSIESQAPGFIRVLSVTRRSRSYHATFNAKWRRYIYLLPLRSDDRMDIDLINCMLSKLVGKQLDYTAFARDTPSGKDCECELMVARAKRVDLKDGSAVCIELVANRFLRRMVRNLVSTLVVLGSTQGQGQMFVHAEFRDPSFHPPLPAPSPAPTSTEPEDALLNLVLSRDRDATSRHPAPPNGLIFAGVGY